MIDGPQIARNLTPRKLRALEDQLANMSLAERLKWFASQGTILEVQTDFGLASQVLTHAIVASGFDRLRFYSRQQATKRPSIRRITAERYDLEIGSGPSQKSDRIFATHIKGMIAIKPNSDQLIINPLADWTVEQLVAYVLDHEVPVDPSDMPGFLTLAA